MSKNERDANFLIKSYKSLLDDVKLDEEKSLNRYQYYLITLEGIDLNQMNTFEANFYFKLLIIKAKTIDAAILTVIHLYLYYNNFDLTLIKYIKMLNNSSKPFSFNITEEKMKNYLFYTLMKIDQPFGELKIIQDKNVLLKYTEHFTKEITISDLNFSEINYISNDDIENIYDFSEKYVSKSSVVNQSI